jgi:hypothetical protein
VALSPDEDLLVKSPYFETRLLRVRGEKEWQGDPDGFHLLICTAGEGRFGDVRFAAGQAWMVPAGTPPFRIRAAEADFLCARVPRTGR